MLPLFKEGDIVMVKDNGRKSQVINHASQAGISIAPHAILRPGDCAVYEVEGKRLLHRVIGEDAGGLWFSDDAWRLEPHFVPWERIEGKALSGNPLKNGRIGLAYSKFRRFLSRYVHSHN